ncbi:hypothetical protein B0J14DRAFT_678779 [Halenospora varia]|nr:hypothetical protein B0J14DRAFT_678779 [Halenospora varia]
MPGPQIGYFPLRGNFFALPRELRDRIYEYSLITPSLIIVRPNPNTALKIVERWQSTCHGTVPGDETYVTQSEYTANVLDTQVSVRNLFLVNKTFGTEATFVFYSKNAFLLASGWVQNRGLLTRLLFNVLPPTRAWELPDGTRERLLDLHDYQRDHPEVTFPRNTHLTLRPQPVTEGVVENLNPAIETFFQLLGPGSKPMLTIKIFLSRGYVPGVWLYPMIYQTANYFGMDTPNLMETFRAPSSAQTGRNIKVLWSCSEGKNGLSQWETATA